MPKRVDCTELQRTITDIAVLLAQQPQFANSRNMVDDIAGEMQSRINGMDRQMLVDAVVAATTQQSQNLTAAQNQINHLKREARRDKNLRVAIDNVAKHLKSETLPIVTQHQIDESDMVAALRDSLSGLRFALRNSKPAVQQRWEKDIAEIEAEISKIIETGEIESTQRPIPTPQGLEALAKRRENARKRLTQLKRSIKTEGQLRESITNLANHLRQQTLPEKRQRIKGTNRIEALREARDGLRFALRRSDPAVRQRLTAGIERLEQKLDAINEGSYVAPVKDVKTPQSKELKDLEFKRDQLQRKVNARINALRPRTVWEHIAEPFNLIRALITSIDFSGFLRQGGFIVFGHPVRAAKLMKPMFQAFASKKKAAQIINDHVLENEDYALAVRSGVDFTDIDSAGPLSKQEEALMSRLAEKIPGVAGSQRSYAVFLNLLRMQSFSTMARTLSINGEPTVEEAGVIANYVNVATGRGNLGRFQAAAVPMNTVFFAPRYVVSRFQLVGFQPLLHGGVRSAPAARVLVAKEYARFAIGLGAFYMMAWLAFGDDDDFSIEGDPRSTDFGKLRFGNTRLDVLAGLQQVVVLTTRLATGESKSARGQIRPLIGENVPYGSDSMGDKVGRFLRYKLAPAISIPWEMRTGEDAVGQPVTPMATALRAVVPLSLRDVYKAIQDQGTPKGTALGLTAILGGSLNVYEDRR